MENLDLEQDLSEACREGDARKVRELLSQGAHPDGRFDRINGWGALAEAAGSKSLECAKALIAAGADSGEGLKRASEEGWPETALLLEAGADPFATPVAGWVSSGKSRELLDMARRARSEPKARQELKMMLAIALDKIEDIRRLAERNDPAEEAEFAKGRSALHWAARWGSPEAIRILAGAGWEVNARDKNGISPDDEAAEGLREPELRELLRLGLDVGGASPDGCSVLHRVLIAPMLKYSSAHPNYKQRDAQARAGCARLLLEAGANPSARAGEGGPTPAELIKDRKYHYSDYDKQEIIALLSAAQSRQDEKDALGEATPRAEKAIRSKGM